MSKHTPGPWEVSEDDPCEVQREGTVAFVAMVLPAPELGWDMNEEREANARLIAAAPDLLALVERLAQRRFTESADNTGDLSAAARELLKRLKATGEP